MKKILGLIMASCILVGCDNVVTNEEIIAEKDKCLKAGMDYVVYEGGMGIPYPIRVTCLKPKYIIQPVIPVSPEKVEK